MSLFSWKSIGCGRVYPIGGAARSLLAEADVLPDLRAGLGYEGVLRSNNGITTATSSGNSGHARFCAESVVIQNKSDHPLIDKACRIMQAKIAERPYVREVQYWPAGAATSDPLSQGDIFIVVDAPSLSEKSFGIKRTVEAGVPCHAGSEPVEKSQHSYYGYSPPVMRFSTNSHLAQSSVFKGFETSKARYQQQSEDIAEQLVGAMTKQSDTGIDKHGLLPELPEYLYITEPNAVTFEFPEEKGTTLLYHSGGLLIDCRTLWTYGDERSNLEAFREVCDSLQAQGWQGGYQLNRERAEGRTVQGLPTNMKRTPDPAGVYFPLALVFRLCHNRPNRGKGRRDAELPRRIGS